MSVTSPAAPQPVHIVLFHAFGGGGVNRSVLNLANHLVEGRPVEVISLFRRRKRPLYTIDPRVRLTVLMDARPGRRLRRLPPRALAVALAHRLLERRPTRLRPIPAERAMSLRTDLPLRRALRRIRTGVLVTTRPSLHLAATRWARPEVVTVGQEHLNFPTRFAHPRKANILRHVVPRLDAYVVLTHADAADYRRILPGLATRLEVIPNALPWSVTTRPAALESEVVVAAGRLVHVKGFDRLINAWGPLARSHPGWRLQIHGVGGRRERLQQQVDRLGLTQQVVLAGYAKDLASVLAGSSVFAMSSRAEGFPMVLIEAMGAGVPVVSFDCPRGPAEIVDPGHNGLLVPDGDVAGLTAALRRLLDDPDLRRRFGAQALEDARPFEVEQVVATWETLFESLTAARAGSITLLAPVAAPVAGAPVAGALPAGSA